MELSLSKRLRKWSSKAGELVLTIIQGNLKANIFVANKDIGFIKKDQPAKIRVDAPFTSHGELQEISSIGADALEPGFQLQTTTDTGKINLVKSCSSQMGRR